MVRSEHVRTLFDSTQSQDSKSEVKTQGFYAAMRIKTHLNKNALYQITGVCFKLEQELVIAESFSRYINILCSSNRR